jgi:thiol-disulfide isomerase/thioredoxin
MPDGPERSDAATDAAASGYRFDRLKIGLILRDMFYAKSDPHTGDRVVDFDLPTLSGGRFRSEDLAETGPVLLVFGSYTCPVTDSSAPGLNTLHAQFGDRVRFVMVSVREAHPGANAPQPNDFEEKREHAERLRDLHDIPFEVAIDDIDGTLHRALSPKPNSAYLLGTDGTILFRAHWANDTKALAQALEAVSAELPLRRTESRGLIRPLWPTVRYVAPTLDRAGRGAWRDMWLAAPPMAAAAFLLRFLHLVPKAS